MTTYPIIAAIFARMITYLALFAALAAFTRSTNQRNQK